MMRNITKVDDDNEYVTKGFLLKTLNETIGKAIEEIVDALTDRFDGRIDRLEKTMATKADVSALATLATKQDILALQDNFVSNYRFDELSLRVHTLEENNNA